MIINHLTIQYPNYFDAVITEIRYSKLLSGYKVCKIIQQFKYRIINLIMFYFVFLLFILYYSTIFCALFHSTQVNWITEIGYSFSITLLISIIHSFICNVIKVLALRCQCMFLYNLFLCFKSFY